MFSRSRSIFNSSMASLFIGLLVDLREVGYDPDVIGVHLGRISRYSRIASL